jgi:hypothetical protein
MPQRARLYLRYALADGEVSRSLILYDTEVNEEGKVFVPSVIWRADGDLENNSGDQKGYVLEMLEMGEPSINKGPILSLVDRRLGGVIRDCFESLAPKILSYTVRRLAPKYLYADLKFQVLRHQPGNVSLFSHRRRTSQTRFNRFLELPTNR